MKWIRWTLLLVAFPYVMSWSWGSFERDILFTLAIATIAFCQWAVTREAKRLGCRWYHVVLFAGDESSIKEVISRRT